MTRTKNPLPPQILQLNELLVLHDKLSKLGINVLYFKGILDYLRLAGKLPLRPKFDIDLLVKNKDFKPLAKLFLADGYTLFLEDITKPLLIETAIKYPQVTFLKIIGKSKIIFDVHLLVLNPTSRFINILPRQLVERITAELFRRRATVKLFNRRFNVLGANDSVLISCLSFFFHHRCQGKSRLNNIASIISATWLNWPFIVASSWRWRLGPCLFIVLRMMEKYTKAAIPGPVLDKLRPSWITIVLSDFFINRWTLTHPIPRSHLVNRALSWSYAALLRLIASTAR